VINVVLTDTGRKIMRRCDATIRNSVKESLSALDDKDVEEMSAALSKLAEIGSKLK
jgi:DNA-binding MarR family transcriptional regulator